MQLTRDADAVNAVMRECFQDPDADYGAMVTYEPNVAIEGEHGCIVFHRVSNRVYHIVLGVRPEGRGRWAAQFLRESVGYMFAHTDALIIRGVIDKGNKASRGLAPVVPGATFSDSSDGKERVVSYRVGRWAKAIGVAKAIEILRRGGQMDKADRIAREAGI